MANVPLWKGGTPEINFMHCMGHPTVFTPPFGLSNYDKTPPFDAHSDNAYGAAGYYTDGMPLIPQEDIMRWQRDNLAYFKPSVGDILRLMVIPCNHYLEHIRFDVNAEDTLMAGATVLMTCEEVTKQTDGSYLFNEKDWITAAATAQAKGNPIDLSTPSSTVVSLIKVTDGYAAPLYVQPTFAPDSVSGVTVRNQECGVVLGLRIVTMPSDADVTFDMMQNDVYLSAKFAEFDIAGMK